MIQATRLENEVVRLDPMHEGNWQELSRFVGDSEMWKHFPLDLSQRNSLEQWVQGHLKSGKWVMYSVYYKPGALHVGSSSYLNIDKPNRVLEIGGTWYGRPYQGTEVNPHCKLLLLGNAFENLGMERVEFKTDVLNTPSRKAIEKLGARQEGILRSNRIVQNGRRRDTAVYSILRNEWAEVKQRLQDRLRSFKHEH